MGQTASRFSPPLLTTAAPSGGPSLRFVTTALLLWLLLAIPLFLAMPVCCDTALYDVQARCVLNGGTAYQDIVEPNLPGAIWIHMAIRSLVGWSSEAVRAADLVLLTTSLVLWTWAATGRFRHVPLVLLAGTFFYMTRTEWCHVQRDTWLLLPTGAALVVRNRRRSPGFCRSAVFEGVLWGTAFWIKPHVSLPALLVMVADVPARRSSWRSAAADIVAVILGGILAAVPGVVWLLQTGAWQSFWTMMTVWNPEYVQAGRERMSLERWHAMARRFSVWLLVVPAAVSLALHTLLRLQHRSDVSPGLRRRNLLSGCLLGWVLQAVGLQHAFDYVHVPGILLSLVLIVTQHRLLPPALARSAVMAFSILAVFQTPFFLPGHLRQWPAAVSSGSTVAVRSALAHGNLPSWPHLMDTVRWLERADVTDGDITCLNVHSVHVYNELKVQPATRYWCVNILEELFPSQADSIRRSVISGGQRFVVCETQELQQAGQTLPDWVRQYPVVYSSGSYQVRQVLRPLSETAHTTAGRPAADF